MIPRELEGTTTTEDPCTPVDGFIFIWTSTKMYRRSSKWWKPHEDQDYKFEIKIKGGC